MDIKEVSVFIKLFIYKWNQDFWLTQSVRGSPVNA